MRTIIRFLVTCALMHSAEALAQTSAPGTPVAPVVPLIEQPLPAINSVTEPILETPATSTNTNPYVGDFRSRSYLAGDLGGARSQLADRGVTMDLFATQFYQGVAPGGRTSGFEYGGKLDYMLNVDGHKLGLWQGLFVNMHAESRFGTDVNGNNGLISPSNIVMHFPSSSQDATAITGLKVTQALSEHFAFYAGKLNTLDSYALKYSPGISSNLPGLAGFQSMALVFNPIVARTVPYSAAGGGAAIIVDGKPILTFSVLDPQERALTGMENLFTSGVTLVPDLVLSSKILGLPNTLNIGGTYSNSRYTTLEPSTYLNLLQIGQLRNSITNGGPVVNNSWSVYASGYQALWANRGDKNVNWGLFSSLGLSDGNPNPIRYSVSGGIGGRSMISGRELDTFGVGYYYLGLSDEFKTLSRAIQPQRDEYGVELFYNFAVTPWCRLTPNLEIARPSTVGTNTAIVTGLRLQMIF